MDRKRKVFVVVMQILLDISLIAYVFSLFTGANENRIGTYSSWATLFFASGSLMFGKQKSESGSKTLDIWSNVNAILFAIMAIFEIFKLIIG